MLYIKYEMHELYVGQGPSTKEVVVTPHPGTGEMRGPGIPKTDGWRRKAGAGTRKTPSGLAGTPPQGTAGTRGVTNLPQVQSMKQGQSSVVICVVRLIR